MGVGLVSMVDARLASGVVYTRDPVSPDDRLRPAGERGLGPGPGVPGGRHAHARRFRVSREDLSVKPQSWAARKPVRGQRSTGGRRSPGRRAEPEVERLSIGESHVRELVRMALRIEEHYGPQGHRVGPGQDQRLFLLQNRPLVFRRKSGPSFPDVSRLQTLRSGGHGVCPGAGAGPVFFASSPEDLARVTPTAPCWRCHPSLNQHRHGRVRAIVNARGQRGEPHGHRGAEYRVHMITRPRRGSRGGWSRWTPPAAPCTPAFRRS